MINCYLNCLFDGTSLITTMFVLKPANDPEVDEDPFKIPHWILVIVTTHGEKTKLNFCVFFFYFSSLLFYNRAEELLDGSIALFNFRVSR